MDYYALFYSTRSTMYESCVTNYIVPYHEYPGNNKLILKIVLVSTRAVQCSA